MPDTARPPDGATAALVLADGSMFWGTGFGAHGTWQATEHVSLYASALRNHDTSTTRGWWEHEVQQRHDRRARPRVARHDLAHLGTRLLGHRRRQAHRSTPPMTGSIDATAEMTSAIMPPSHIAATACKLVNDGSR